MCTLPITIDKLGRDEFGMNRAPRGYEPSQDNIFVGNVYGLFTFKAGCWLEREESFKKESFGPAYPNHIVWDIIHGDSNERVVGWTNRLLQQIARLSEFS